MLHRNALVRQAACCVGGATLIAASAIPVAFAAPTAGPRPGTHHLVRCNSSALISAIQAANGGNGGILVLTPRCTYTLTTALTGQDGLPAITKHITVIGNQATVQRASSATAPFRIFDVASGGNLDLRNLTVQGGMITGQPELGAGIQVQADGDLELACTTVTRNTSERNGGGVAVLGTATIVGSRLVANSASFGAGLVQFGSTASTTIRQSEIQHNVASFDGGGLEFGGGTARVSDTAVNDNTATSGDGGGGIFNDADLQLVRTGVDRNTAGVQSTLPGGGGIYNDGTLYLNNSSVSDNKVTGGTAQGGAIYNLGGSVTFMHARITGNSAPIAPGGLWTTTPFGTAGSLVARNTPTNCKGSPVIPTGCVN
jgi:hypothetical protein